MMRAIWHNPRRLIFAALMGAALWVVNFTQAHLLTPIAPALPAVLAGFTVPFFLVTSHLVTQRLGAITASYLTFAGLATFNLVMGPPGLHKLLLALLSAGAFDLTMLILRRAGGWKLFVGFTVYTIVSLASYVGAFVVLDLPGKDRLLQGLAAFAAVFFVEGLVSVWFAIWFYRKWLLTVSIIAEWHDE